MAKIKFDVPDDLELQIQRISKESDAICKQALYAGAGVLADEVRQRLEALPEDNFHFLQPGDQFDGLTDNKGIAKSQKEDLAKSYGISKITVDRNGVWSVRLGFDGYGRVKTKKYPKGLPNPLLARSIESGSSVRKKHPFVGPAVRAKRQAALEAMERAAGEAIDKITKG